MPRIAWADLDALREASYRFHASVLLPPDPERVAGWSAMVAVIDAADPETFAFASAWRRLRARLDQTPQDLRAEHVGLFDAAVDGALCPPYESHWRAAARHGGPALVTSDLVRTYRSFGLSVSPRGAVTADHVATELEALAFLCRAEQAAREAADPVGVRRARHRQIDFLDDHLGRWLPSFADRLALAARRPRLPTPGGRGRAHRRARSRVPRERRELRGPGPGAAGGDRAPAPVRPARAR